VEKISFNAGYFISNVDTDLRLGSGLSLTVNVEDLLAFNLKRALGHCDMNRENSRLDQKLCQW
jgi:hypothetical protein